MTDQISNDELRYEMLRTLTYYMLLTGSLILVSAFAILHEFGGSISQQLWFAFGSLGALALSSVFIHRIDERLGLVSPPGGDSDD